jgi:hypothetical protein
MDRMGWKVASHGTACWQLLGKVFLMCLMLSTGVCVGFGGRVGRLLDGDAIPGIWLTGR